MSVCDTAGSERQLWQVEGSGASPSFSVAPRQPRLLLLSLLVIRGQARQKLIPWAARYEARTLHMRSIFLFPPEGEAARRGSLLLIRLLSAGRGRSTAG